MFAVIFEVLPRPGRMDRYLALAASLRPELERIPGFVSVQRFSGVARPGWLLSLSFWRDEAALTRWRAHAHHHAAQNAGRHEVFEDYHLRVGQVIADAAPGGPVATPARRTAYNAPDAASPGFVRIAEAATDPAPPEAGERWDSLATPGRSAWIAAGADEAASLAWQARALPALAGEARLRVVEVERDYGMFRREQAPQFYPPVAPEPAPAG